MRQRLEKLNLLSLPILLALQAVGIILGSWLWTGDLRGHLSDLARYVLYGKGVLAGQWPYIDFNCEYPPGALIPMVLPALTVRHVEDVNDAMTAMLPALFVQAAIFCALTTVILSRLHPDRPAVLRRFVLLTILLTPILAYRFDTAPMLVTAAALGAFVSGAWLVSGGLIGLGTLIKLYPAAFLPLVLTLLVVRSNWRGVSTLVIGFTAVLLMPFAIYAFKAPLAPLRFIDLHLERGLQVESTWAGLALIGRDLVNVPTQIVARFGSIEIDSAWAVFFQHVQRVVMSIAYAACLAYCGWIARRAKVTTAIVSEMFGLTLIVLLLASKVFSTQYIVWLLPFCLTGTRRRFWLVVAIVVATLYVYPFGLPAYRQMAMGKVIFLNLRTILLLTLGVLLARSLWIAPASEPHPSEANSASASAS